MAYTAAMFGKATENAQIKVDDIIGKALERAKQNPSSVKAIRDETADEIETFQRQLHQGWKGHGPEILETALAKLDDAFKHLVR